MRSRVLAFARLGRPHFLVGGLAMYGLGASVAARQQTLSLRAYAWGQAAITATQLMTHYANEYFDLEADIANATPSPWSGGSRVLPRGDLEPRVALAAAVVLAGIALGLDVFVGLRVAGNPTAFPLLLATLALAWAYSAPPLRLCARGLGAPTVALVVTMLTPLAGYFLQAPGPLAPPVVAALPLVCAQIAMILVIDFPDAAGDTAAGKKTLAVRFGRRATAQLCVAMACAPFLGLPALVYAGLPARVALAVASTAPIAGLLVVSLARGDADRPGRWARLTWLSVAWLVLLAAAELGSGVSLATEGGPPAAAGPGEASSRPRVACHACGMSSPLRAHVTGGRLVLDAPTNLPEGAEVELLPMDDVDDLEPAERARLHGFLADSIRRHLPGTGVPAET